MKKHYKALGLEEGASKAEIEKKYKELTKEYDPKNNDNQEFFKEEYEKLQEAYKALITSNILKNPEKIPKKRPVNSGSSVSEEKPEEPDNTPIIPINNPVKQENYILRNALLLFIAAGVWGLFMQNMGLFVPSDDYTQKVRVVNTVDTEVQGSVNVNGQVGVYNTVDINISEILGRSAGTRRSYTIDGQQYNSLDVSVR
jgi:hypothetical protein